MKRENPYTRLKRICAKWAIDVLYPKRIEMYVLGGTSNGGSYSMGEIHQRVAAAEQLKHRVEIKTRGKDLVIQYVEIPPQAPWELDI